MSFNEQGFLKNIKMWWKGEGWRGLGQLNPVRKNLEDVVCNFD